MHSHKFPLHGWIGLALIAVFWPVNWLLEGPRTHWAFFPLWLGYALTVDGLVYLRKGTSLSARNWKKYVGLFLLSAPAWWLFELFNLRLQNWVYVGRETFTNLEYALLTSLSFSTVIPAVFGTAELMGTFKLIRNRKRGWEFHVPPWGVGGFFLLGWAMLGLMLAWPRYFFPFVWLSVYFIVDAVNVWLGNPNLKTELEKGDWRGLWALWSGVLVTGFFWEMWNYHSYPKWIYHVPFVDFAHIFEMPLLGYGGYLPFAMELFALYNLAMGVLGLKRTFTVKDIVGEEISD